MATQVSYQTPAASSAGLTPMHMAAGQGDVAAIKTLLAGGVDVNVQDTLGRGKRPLHIAVLNGKVEAIKTLAEAGADMNVLDANKKRPINYAVCSGVETTRTLLKLGADPDGIDATAPMLASEQGHAVMVEPLLSNGANVAQLPHNGLSGDDLTAQHGRADFSPRLIENTINYRSLLYLYDEE